MNDQNPSTAALRAAEKILGESAKSLDGYKSALLQASQIIDREIPAEKLIKALNNARADLEWFQTDYQNKSSMGDRINRVDWTIDNINDALKLLTDNAKE